MGEHWQLPMQAPTSTPPWSPADTQLCRSADSHKRWVLRDASGKGTHTGTPEASLTGTRSGHMIEAR